MNLGEGLMKVFLNYFCNFPVILKVFKNKNKIIYKEYREEYFYDIKSSKIGLGKYFLSRKQKTHIPTNHLQPGRR